LASIVTFGSYIPERIVTNPELALKLECTPEWILEMSGIEERRYAAPEEGVVEMAVRAGQDCLEKAGCSAAEIRTLIVSSGTSPQRFPGPAAIVAQRLGLGETPSIDMPVASAGALLGLALAARMDGPVLSIASEKMSEVIAANQEGKNAAILFGDGAGACLVHKGAGMLRIVDSQLGSDGTYAADLRLPLAGPVEMNGRSVILQASRKIPRAIGDVLARNSVAAKDVTVFLMHQANQNLIDRVAKALGVESKRFYSNIRLRGNTSSSSMLIAAAEWSQSVQLEPGAPICFAAFGAGFHWGAILAEVE
jgi:3-oxoacyl-[acyl-carrier-protein] synthase III